jgi:hypothetical protein
VPLRRVASGSSFSYPRVRSRGITCGSGWTISFAPDGAVAPRCDGAASSRIARYRRLRRGFQIVHGAEVKGNATATVLFSDLDGGTDLLAERGEACSTSISRCCGRRVAEHAGREIKTPATGSWPCSPPRRRCAPLCAL